MKIQMEDRFNAVRRAMAGIVAVACAGTIALGAAGCSNSGASSDTSGAATASTSSAAQTVETEEAGSLPVSLEPVIDESAYDLEYSDRDQDPSYDEADAVIVALSDQGSSAQGDGVSVDDSTVTISAAGVYVLSGTLTDGQVVVDAPDDAKVQLVLDGASITNADEPAIYVRQADKCFVTLAEGSSNDLADGAAYADEGADADATLYSDCDLTLQGSGALTVTASFNDAVKTKDDLVVTGGTYTIKSVGDGLVGHDSVKVKDGTFSIEAQNDAVKSSKDDDAGKGFVAIDGGSIDITAADKGINAVTFVRIADGAVIDIDADDDAIHSEYYARIAGGDITIASGDDAVHAEYVLAVDEGSVNVTECVEGYEAQVITVNGSTTSIVASDDGINASTGGDSSSSEQAQQGFGDDGDMMPSEGGQMPGGEAPQDGQMPDGQAPQGGQMPGGEMPQDDRQGDRQMPDQGQMPEGGTPQEGQGMGGRGGQGMGGGPMADADEACVLTINGGTITVEAAGDGLDSNGYLYVNGGETYVSGPTNSGNGSIDYGLGAEVTGGVLIAAGSSGMAESFTGGTQAFALVQASGSAGDTVSVTDASGQELASFTPTKSFQCVVVTAPGMEDGQSYELKVNDASTSFTASTEAAAAGMGGGMGPEGQGGQGGPGGQRPDGGRQGGDPRQGGQQGQPGAMA